MKDLTEDERTLLMSALANEKMDLALAMSDNAGSEFGDMYAARFDELVALTDKLEGMMYDSSGEVAK